MTARSYESFHEVVERDGHRFTVAWGRLSPDWDVEHLVASCSGCGHRFGQLDPAKYGIEGDDAAVARAIVDRQLVHFARTGCESFRLHRLAFEVMCL